MQNFRICVLGTVGDSYTKMVVKALHDLGIEFSVVLEGSISGRTSSFSRLMSLPLQLYRALNCGRYKALPKLSFFTWKIFLREKFYYRQRESRSILKKYESVNLTGTGVPYINHVKTLREIESQSYDFGLFAGVGIVDAEIISAFKVGCLNAHPGPLPQCRGGGALINTLCQGLRPAVSVHVATSEIDAGDVLLVKELDLRASDGYDSVTLRLAVLCAETLADAVAGILSGEISMSGQPNTGVIHYWKDCALEKQRNAERQLSRMLHNL